MCKIENLIYQRLADSADLDNLLAKYNGKPAIFQKRAPDDSDELWEGDPYPRMIYEVELKEEMEREFSKRIRFHVICKKGQQTNSRDFKMPILTALDRCFFTKIDVTLGTRWSHTEPGALESGTSVEETIYTFNGMLFTKQEMIEPDPVAALNSWLKNTFEDAVIIGRDALEDIWKPGNSGSAIYCRLESMAPGSYKDTWCNSWITAGIRIHIVAVQYKKLSMIREITQKLAGIKSLTMSDGGPLYIMKVNYNDTLNPLKHRQFFIECQYGVLRQEEEKQPIRNIDIQEG